MCGLEGYFGTHCIPCHLYTPCCTEVHNLVKSVLLFRAEHTALVLIRMQHCPELLATLHCMNGLHHLPGTAY